MTSCRCKIINVLSGDPARDYVNVHLEPESAQRPTADGPYRCPDTGITWMYEHDARHDVPRLRRTDHRR